MIDGKITEFVDQLYYGQELVFLYKGKKLYTTRGMPLLMLKEVTLM